MREPRRLVKARLRTTGRNKAACDEAASDEIRYFFTPTANIVDVQDLRLVDSDYQRSYSDLYWEGTYLYEWTERE